MTNPTPNAVLGATDDGRLRIYCPACEWDATYPSLDAVTAMQIVRQHAGDHAAKAESEHAVRIDEGTLEWEDEQAQDGRYGVDPAARVRTWLRSTAERVAELTDQDVDDWLAVLDELKQLRAAQAVRDAEPKPCVCGDPNCMPYWRSVHEQMNTMRVWADKGAADFTTALLEQVVELGTELDKLRARREDEQAKRDSDVQAADTAPRQEWGYRWREHKQQIEGGYESEADARLGASRGAGSTIVTRFHGGRVTSEWQDVPNEAVLQEGTSCLCGCPLGQSCQCGDDADHGDPREQEGGLG